jgi:ADP-ribose pyrophosphatase
MWGRRSRCARESNYDGQNDQGRSKMNFKLVWQRLRPIIFTTLAVSFVILDVLMSCPHLYLVTGYILFVTIFILYVQLWYHEPIHPVNVPDFPTKLEKNKSAPLRLSEILQLEFEYVKETASEATNDRLTMLNYFLLSAGVVAAGIGVMVSKEGGYEFPYRDESVIALSLIFNVVGWVYFLNQVRLRQAWCESARAMNHIKQFFVKYSEYPPEMAEAAFRWNIESIPKASKKMTVFYFSALLISILSSASIVLASIILLGMDQISKFWFIPMILGFYHLFFQMSMYAALLDESASSTGNRKNHGDVFRASSSQKSVQTEMIIPKIVELKEEQVVFEDFFKITVGRFRFEKFNGQMSDEVRRLCIERGDSVAVVLFNRQSKALILVAQFRYPVYRAQNHQNGWLYELVAGMVEPGESLEDVVRREVMEEAGYSVENIELLARIYPSPGGTSERIYIYYAEVTQRENEGGGIAAEHEDIRVIELPVDRVYEMVKQGLIEDAKTFVGLLCAKEWIR